MSLVRAHNISVSLDGFMAGPDQSETAPLGAGGERLHEWAFQTRTLRAMFGQEGGTTGVDDAYAAQGDAGVGATVIGRHMFGPVRGPWPDESWRGWWGDEPPYHHPVFVLTHHPRPALEMAGGTTFHFVTDGVQSALARATAAADGADVRVGGGAATLQQLLRAGLLDRLHVAYVPVLLGAGERLWDRLGEGPVGYRCTSLVQGEGAVHALFERA